MESVILDRQQGYYDALAVSDNAGSSETFVEFMLRAIRDALRPYVDEGMDGAIGNGRLELEHQALLYFAEHERATIRDMANHLGLSQRTAERLVQKLKRAGKLRREGSPRAGHWIVDEM